jgi:tetratricopeptide (TPR) repeat protein
MAMRKGFPGFLILSGLIFGLGITPARPAPDGKEESSAQAEADRCFQKQDWPCAEKGYQEIAGRDSGNGRAWFRLGVSRQSQAKYAEAIQAYLRAEEIGHNPLVRYNLATAYAKQGQKDAALEWLGKAADAGFEGADSLASDPDLASIRDDPRFKALAARIAAPCAGVPEARQFDFWIGNWEVRNPKGDLSGHNRIDLILGDCVLLENWTGARGGSGKSFNVYNQAKGKWQQTWIDNHGEVIEFTDGELHDNVLRFRAETRGPDGKPLLRRLSFFNLGPDRVRQFSEQSSDGGKSWTTEYDLTYTRIP